MENEEATSRVERLRIALVWDDGAPAAGGAVRPDGTPLDDARPAVAAIEGALRAAGHATEQVTVGLPLSRCLQALERGGFDLVFNLCEGVGDCSTGEVAVAGLFELAQLPYTGSDPTALALALDKARAKAVLAHAGVPTPRAALMDLRARALPAELRFPLIVKPAREDGSLGIEDAAVVHDAAALFARVAWVDEHFSQPALVEEYVDGRELNVAVLGDGDDRFTLPVAEIDFSGLPAGRPRILSFDAKWREESLEFRATVPVVPAPLPDATTEGVCRTALAAAAALGVRDYARVDLRLDRDGRPWVLEVNPNPDLSPDAGLPKAAKVHGWNYDRLILELVAQARRRELRPRRSVRWLEPTASR